MMTIQVPIPNHRRVCRNNATNAAAARYLASLQLNGGSEFSSLLPAQFLQQEQQGNQATQHTHSRAIHCLTSVPQDARPFGERSDGSVLFVPPPRSSAAPSYPPNTAFSQLRPAAADSRAHIHLQFGNHSVSPMKGLMLPLAIICVWLLHVVYVVLSLHAVSLALSFVCLLERGSRQN